MKNRKHTRRVKRLALICTLCTIILVVSTYAWFIGMRTVNVSTFDVEIASTEGLYLSLNGKDWSETVNINASNYKYVEEDGDDNVVYKGSTNTWGGVDEDGNIVGLIPMSSVGEIDSTASRLTLFEKGSLTTTDGGYRLMASRVDNHTTLTGEEGTGFVAFDLFIKNLSGNEYYPEFNQLNEEAIYLTQSSKVEVKNTGANDPQLKTGIENSVRVAFAQIGRVVATEDTQDTITGITCASNSDVTGICTRYAQIWEPNDKDHVQNAINWYDTSCVKRTGSPANGTEGAVSGFDYATTDNKCTTVANGAYSQTYAVGSVIDHTNFVDVYDGTAYNTFTKTISTTKLSEQSSSATFKASENEGVLYEYDYFTDTEKMLTGMDRPTFMTLAPNSITKVRVYIYIEGQDVDNYDFASLGKRIQVNFGFTKERFYNTDINYDGPMTSENGAIPVTPETVS